MASTIPSRAADPNLRLSKKRRKVRKEDAMKEKNLAMLEKSRKVREAESGHMARKAKRREDDSAKHAQVRAEFEKKREADVVARKAVVDAKFQRRMRRAQRMLRPTMWNRIRKKIAGYRRSSIIGFSGKGNSGGAIAFDAAQQLGMGQGDLRSIKNAFELIDLDDSGEVSYTEFWEFMRDPLSSNKEGALRTVYSDSLFALIDEDGSGTLDYPEFFSAVTMFAMYDRDDIVQFCFECFDEDNSGQIEEDEMVKMIKSINRSEPMFPANYESAVAQFDINDDGVLDLDEFRSMCRLFPMVFHPAFELQDLVQKSTLGRSRWLKFHKRENRKRLIINYRNTHAGQYPPLTCRQNLWKHICTGRNPHAVMVGDDDYDAQVMANDPEKTTKSRDEVLSRLTRKVTPAGSPAGSRRGSPAQFEIVSVADLARGRNRIQ